MMMCQRSTFEPLESRVHLSASAAHAGSAIDATDCGGVHVFAPHSTVKGKTLGEYAADWWKWASLAPVPVNPTLDTTGANAALNQGDKVFFIAGGPGGTFDRTVCIPSGTNVFFPVANAVWVTFPDDPVLPVDEYRNFIRPTVDQLTGMYATIDGCPVDVAPHRETDPGGFQVTVPQDNLYGLDPGTYGPAVTDGYWLMLSPLSKGEHTITFGTNPTTAGGFDLDVTYHINVVPKGQYRKQPCPPAQAAQPACGCESGKKDGARRDRGAAANVLTEAR
jgi:hypothetical protein